MTDLSKTTLPSVEDGSQNGDMYSNTWTSSNNTSSARQDQDRVSVVIVILMLCINIVGLVGNGIVICLLGFDVKRSPFTTYVLNLAVADFGFLLLQSPYCILELTDKEIILGLVMVSHSALSMYSASQLLLTAISIDRCVSVLFPIWHRCHRPPHLSAITCAIIWVLSFLSWGSAAITYLSGLPWPVVFYYLFTAGAVLCLPLVTASTLILLFKVFCKPRQPRRGRLLTIIFLTLLFFLIFAYPLNVILLRSRFPLTLYLTEYALLCACLNSCVNPVIYYMVGRKKRGQKRQSLKVILQRVFKEEEEEEHREEGGAHSPDITTIPPS